jgi:membrane protein involved in colicin uptake
MPLTELEELRQFSSMKTGQTIVETLDFAASLSGSSSQSSSSDESASKRHKTTGIYPLNTTDFITSNKVGVDMDLLKKVESEELKAEKKMAKEAREANRCEESEVQQKAIEDANLLARESREERKRANEVKVDAKVDAKKRAKEMAKERAEGKKVALALAALIGANEQRGWLGKKKLQVESAIIGPRKTMAPRAFWS